MIWLYLLISASLFCLLALGWLLVMGYFEPGKPAGNAEQPLEPPGFAQFRRLRDFSEEMIAECARIECRLKDAEKLNERLILELARQRAEHVKELELVKRIADSECAACARTRAIRQAVQVG